MESQHDLISLFEHDLHANASRVGRERKPVSTLRQRGPSGPDHALARSNHGRPLVCPLRLSRGEMSSIATTSPLATSMIRHASPGRQVFVKCGMANTSLVNAWLRFEPIDVSHQDSTSSTERGLSPSLTNGDHHAKNCTHHLRCAADLGIGGPDGSGFPAPPPRQGPPQPFSRSL